MFAMVYKRRTSVVGAEESRPNPVNNSLSLSIYLLAISELRKRPGNSDVDNASRDCFLGRAFCCSELELPELVNSLSIYMER